MQTSCGKFLDAVVHKLILQIRRKRKKATVNPKNKDDKCFHHAVTVALNYKKIEPNPKIISKIKLFINKYNRKRIRYPSSLENV